MLSNKHTILELSFCVVELLYIFGSAWCICVVITWHTLCSLYRNMQQHTYYEFSPLTVKESVESPLIVFIRLYLASKDTNV